MIDPGHAHQVGQPAVVAGPEDQVRPAARVLERPARRKGAEQDGIDLPATLHSW